MALVPTLVKARSGPPPTAWLGAISRRAVPEPWLRILAFTGLGGAVLFGLIRAVPDAVDIIR